MTASRTLTYKILLVVALAVLILGYGLFQARNLIIGPKINVLTPTNGENLTDPLVTVSGTASNITRISLNDRQIFVDNNGNFSEKLLVPPGYTIIKLAAQDKFGRTTQKVIELNYTTVATSSATNTDVGTSTGTSTEVIIQ